MERYFKRCRICSRKVEVFTNREDSVIVRHFGQHLKDNHSPEQILEEAVYHASDPGVIVEGYKDAPEPMPTWVREPHH